MAGDIPTTTDEIRREELASLPLRRWLWSPWTWLATLASCLGLFALLEMRILSLESNIAEQLRLRGYTAIYDGGWFRRLLPAQWRDSYRTCGDRIVRICAYLTPRDLEPLDELIPELQKLQSLNAVEFVNPAEDLGPADLPTSIESIDRCVATLHKVGGIKFVTLSHFHESQISEDFVQSLQPLDIERILLFSCRSTKAEVTHLEVLSRLKRVELIFCLDPNAGRELQRERPDITVDVTTNLSGFGYF